LLTPQDAGRLIPWGYLLVLKCHAPWLPEAFRYGQRLPIRAADLRSA
jgi:hypothetical protein